MAFPNGISLDLDFTAGSLPGGVTFTRASTATDGQYTDAAGSSYNSYSANVPRISANGLLVEDIRTNYLLNSDTPATQTINTAARTYILWVIGTGSATIASAGSTGSGFGTATAGSPVTVVISVGGNTTITVTGSLTRFQLESSVTGVVPVASPTSYIPTAGAAATRAIEGATLATGAWYNSAGFTLAAEAMIPFARSVGICGMASIDDGTANNRFSLTTQGTGLRAANWYTAGTADVTLAPAGTFPVATPFGLAGTFTSGAMTAVFQAGAVSSGAPAHFTGGAFTNLSIGLGWNNGAPLNGYVRRVRAWPFVMPNADLQLASKASPQVPLAASGMAGGIGSLDNAAGARVGLAGRGGGSIQGSAGWRIPIILAAAGVGAAQGRAGINWGMPLSLMGQASSRAQLGAATFVGLSGRAQGAAAGLLQPRIPILLRITGQSALIAQMANRSIVLVNSYGFAAGTGRQTNRFGTTMDAMGLAASSGSLNLDANLSQIIGAGMAGSWGGNHVTGLARVATQGMAATRGMANPRQYISALGVSNGAATVSGIGGATVVRTLNDLLTALTPDYQLQEKPRLLTAPFGDGYTQTTPDGLMAIQRTLTLGWQDFPVADIDMLEQFFRGKVGKVINFVAPRDTAPRNWIVMNWHRTHPQPNSDSLSVSLEERPFVDRSIILGVPGYDTLGEGVLV